MRRQAMRCRWVSALLLLPALGCARGPADRSRQDSTTASHRTDSARAIPAARDSASGANPSAPESRDLVRPADLSPAMRATCDSAAVIVRKVLALDVRREDGSYFDSARETPRIGCRLTALGSFATFGDSLGPVDAVAEALKKRGWRADLRYMADGPDGSDVGLRLRDMLCQVVGHWNGGDEEEDTAATPRPRTEEENRFQAIVECARDIASNQDAGVPDSMWNIASSAGLDSVYAISVRMQYPPYLDGDFDGDGVPDAAVLVEHRASGKMGILILRGGPRQVYVLGAGNTTTGPDDLSWIDQWDVFRKTATMHLTIHDRPNTQLIADALWVGRRDSLSAFYVWTGSGYEWEAHGKPR